jgi:hypothetical protein
VCKKYEIAFIIDITVWVEVVYTILYLINRGPSSSLNGGFPEEAWLGTKVNYSFMKSFCCESFVHIYK